MPLILILIFIYSVSTYSDISVLSVHSGSSWYQYVTYNFCHYSAIHLITNGSVFLIYWNKIIKPHTNLCFSIPTISVSAVISAMLAAEQTNTMGLSAVCYSMIAIYAVGMKSPYGIPFRERIRFLIILSLSFVVTCFLPNMNTLLHLYALSISIIISIIIRKFMYAEKNKK